MKILQIDVSVNIGSTGKIAEEIGLKIIENGGESFIGYGRHFRPSRSETIKIGNRLDQAFHLLQTRFFDRHALASAKATETFIDKIREINPDIIHLHQIHGYFLNIEKLCEFLKVFGKPLVWTFHDCWAITGHCGYFSPANCEKWKTECHSCPQLSSYPASYFIDNSKNNYRIKKSLFSDLPKLTIVPVSYWMESVIKESFLKRHQTQVIYNGVDLDVFKPRDAGKLRIKYNLGNKKIILGIAAIWSELKGLKAFIELAKNHFDNRTVIILLGLTEKQIRSLPENIIGIGTIENVDELAEFYSLAEVFVNPSIAESFGLVTAEALACGTPVVAYNVTATPELVKEGTGFVVEKNDISMLHSSIVKIMNAGKTQYAADCRKTAETFFNKKTQYKKYIELYDSLLAE